MRRSKNTVRQMITSPSGEISLLALASFVLTNCSKLFAGEDLIHVTGKESPVSLWTKPDQCLWNAPDFLTGWYSLSDQEGFRGNEKLKRLFKSVLDVQDADWTHYLQQLQAYKDQGLRQNDIRDIYHRLWREVEGENWRNVR